jgi:hypothetical protein
MIYAAATDSAMVVDLSGTLQTGMPIYGKAGGMLLIDFKNDEAFLYGHSGVGVGYSTGLTYSVGLVSNYTNPEALSGPSLALSGGAAIGASHSWSPEDGYCESAKVTALTFSKGSGASIGLEFEYYTDPIPLFNWGGN